MTGLHTVDCGTRQLAADVVAHLVDVYDMRDLHPIGPLAVFFGDHLDVRLVVSTVDMWRAETLRREALAELDRCARLLTDPRAAAVIDAARREIAEGTPHA